MGHNVVLDELPGHENRGQGRKESTEAVLERMARCKTWLAQNHNYEALDIKTRLDLEIVLLKIEMRMADG